MRHNDKIEDAAARWLARQMSGTMSLQEEEALKKWLSDNPLHKKAFDALHELSAALKYQEHDLLTEAFEEELHTLAARQERKNFHRRAAIAASFFVLLVSSVVGLSSLTNPTSETYTTALGERERYALPDGSTIELNTNSQVEVSYSKQKRIAEIESGEAVFDVARNPKRPFLVRTQYGDIRVTGTTFIVRLQGGKSTIQVVSGAVEVSPLKAPPYTLLAGQQLHIHAEGVAGSAARFDPNYALAWRNGKARFDNQPLKEVAEELNRYFTRPLVLEDETLASLPVTGEFDIDDQRTAIAALSLAFSLEAQPEPSRIILRKSRDGSL